jgi:DNA-directed RNA polymerase I, II, and III subunit RPABC2
MSFHDSDYEDEDLLEKMEKNEKQNRNTSGDVDVDIEDDDDDYDSDNDIEIDGDIERGNNIGENEDDDEDDDDDNEEYNEDDVDVNMMGGAENSSSFIDLNLLSDDDEEDEEQDDDNYLQKLDENMKKKIISDFHPELHMHNNDEIEILSRVVRNEKGVIIDPLHKTIPFITRYEKARILGERAKQINNGANPMIEIEPTLIDGYLIAIKEFEEKKIPFIIKRPLPNGGCEYWKLSDLEDLM